MGVKATHKEYDRLSKKWQRCRDVIAGQDAMHAAGTRHLAKLKDESDDDYRARVSRSDFFNATWRTIDALSAMVMRKDPTVDVPAGIEPYLEDVTLAGEPMEDFAEECVVERLSIGLVGILVDHPPRPENVQTITVAVAQKLGLRPTLQRYAGESIRNWKKKRINNAWVYTQVVLGEQHEEPKEGDEFETVCTDRYRVLDLEGENGTYRQRLFEVRDNKDVQIGPDIVPMMNGQPLDFIPFRLAGDFDDPPLIDLVDKNVAHYQVNSDYRHGLHFCGLPTAFFAGVTPPDNADGSPGKIYIGGSAAITTSEPTAKAEFLEFTGQGLQPMEKALDRLERQMAVLGARMLADESKSQVETLGATRIKFGGENSILAKIVKSTSRTLEWALTVFAKWAGQDAKIVYQLNRDFLPTMMDAQQLNALFAGVVSGNISKQELFVLLQRGDVIDGEKSYDEHQREIDESTPDPARPRPKPKPGEEPVAA